MKKIALLLLMILLTVGTIPTVYAAAEIAEIDAFSGIEGINKADNYFLDTADLTLFDAVLIAYHLASNILFGAIVKTVKLTCSVYYYTTSVNLTDIFSSQISDIQRNLKNDFFDAIIPLTIGLMGFSIAGYMLKRNFQGVVSQFVKLFVVFASVGILSTYSIEIITLIDGITTTASSVVMNAVSGQNSGENYSVITAKELWRALIHEPWKGLEFGKYTPDQKTIDDLLSGTYTPLSDERREYIDKIHDKNAIAFNKSMPLSRLTSIYIHYQFASIQCLIYGAYGILIFTFRFLTIFLMIMGVFFMVVSLFPTSKGYTLIKDWARRIVDFQLNILTINFIVSFMLIVNNMLYQKINDWGFLVVEVIQAVFALIIFLFRKQIMGIFTTASNSASGQVKRATSQIHHALAVAGATGGAMHYRNIIAGMAGNKASESASAAYSNNSSAPASNPVSNYSGAGAEPSPTKSAEQKQAASPALGEYEQMPASGLGNSEVTDTLRQQDTTKKSEPEAKLDADAATDTQRPSLVNSFHWDNSAFDKNPAQNTAHIGNVTTYEQPAASKSARPDGEYQSSGVYQPSLTNPPDKKTKKAGSDQEKAPKTRKSEQAGKDIKKRIEGQTAPSNSTRASNIPIANGTYRESTKKRPATQGQGPVLVD